MARVKRGYTARRRRKSIMKAARGFYGGRSRIYRIAIQAVQKSWQNQYRDRRLRKRDFRGLWIQRINAAVRLRLESPAGATEPNPYRCGTPAKTRAIRSRKLEPSAP